MDLKLDVLKYQAHVVIHSPHAGKYLSTLCRHFGRKVKSTWDEERGVVEFPIGVSKFEYDDKKSELIITCYSGDKTQLDRQQLIIESHVHQFSRRETLILDWV
ncbi:MAG: DUF2218 domain-containing protein [Vibrio gallaecicus]